MEVEINTIFAHLLTVIALLGGVYLGHRLAKPKPAKPPGTGTRVIDAFFGTLGVFFFLNEITIWLFQWPLPYRSIWIYFGIAAGFTAFLRGSEVTPISIKPSA